MATESPWIQTVSGKKFQLVDPDITAIDIEDIAHGLSMLSRFNGQALQFYSVAEHSVYVSQLVSPEVALWGLLHDAAEAYLGDMPSPLKGHVKEFKTIEMRLLRLIALKFGLPETEPVEVKTADRSLLLTERLALMVAPPEPWPVDLVKPAVVAASVQIECWSQGVAKQRFLETYHKLGGGLSA